MDNMYLSKESLALLRRFERGLSESEIKSSEESCLEQLLSFGFIESHIVDYDISIDMVSPVFSEYQITESGKAYLYNHKIENRFRYIPICISIFAAIGGYREEIYAIIQAVMKLLKTLTGN